MLSRFSASARFGTEKRLDLVVTLKDWNELEEVDRIGLDRELYEILKIQVRTFTIPVARGAISRD